MTGVEWAAHWDEAYSHGDTTRSWYQPEAAPSLAILDRCGVTPAHSVVDVGGGASTLADDLLARGHQDLSVLDVSSAGESIARRRLGSDADAITWIVADVLAWQPERTYDVWHDRALFHFLTAAEARSRYLDALAAATEPGSIAVLATFAPDGPDSCSGLPVARYDVESLAAELGVGWRAVVEEREEHTTPAGAVQPFTWAALRRSA